MQEARFYEKLEGGAVACQLCRHECSIKPGKRGICQVRENRDGTLYTLVYDRLVSLSVDPVEKKPFFHVRPGSGSLSIATVGCNLTCKHCQNHSISQAPRRRPGRIPGDDVPPARIAAQAVARRCASLAYTYTEPTIYFELAWDTMQAAAELSVLNLWVTNGFMSAGLLEHMAGVLAGANVDVKSFSESFYRKICGGRLQPVLDNVALMRKLGIWVEVTTLVIPGYNDDEAELRELAAWMASVDPAMPWHLSRFHPDNDLLDAPPTPVQTLTRAREIARQEGVQHVYSGNVPGDEGEHTSCPKCGARLIERFGYRLRSNRIRGGCCPECQAKIPGLWS